ncbi:MAG: TIGR00341 family protein, partial [Candidatus Promineifilaceae bacterium]|nr:TIGR00341 family protein [Candidatus Promineifilaceae bacterium]
MKIIEGELPPESKRWRVLIPHSCDIAFGKSWQLALLIAESGVGQVLLAATVASEAEDDLARAREFLHLASQYQRPKLKIFPFIVQAAEYEREVNEFIRDQDVDVLVDDISDPIHHDLNRCPCAVAAVRGDIRDDENGNRPIKRIAVPTSGGPNTVYALSMLMHAAPEVEIDALYFAAEAKGEHEMALGRTRLRQVLEYIDGQQAIHSQVISTTSIIDGIREAAKDYDLVVIGATRESSIDKVLFGNIPDAVVRDSKSTMVIIREPKNAVAHALGLVAFRLQQILPRLSLSARTDAYVRIRQSARPNIDYYILISLAAIIAGLGLIANSAAVVIGAMLVAPLMSPIVGSGLATVLGDTRFLRLSLGAVIRGALLAIFLGMIVGIFQIGTPLNSELLARTQPSLLDLAIALFSGMAAAFALSRSNAAGALPGVAIAAALVPPLATVGITFTAGYYVQSLGSLLLFVTNFVAIGTATALVFIILGFRPSTSQKARQRVRLR